MTKTSSSVAKWNQILIYTVIIHNSIGLVALLLLLGQISDTQIGEGKVYLACSYWRFQSIPRWLQGRAALSLEQSFMVVAKNHLGGKAKGGAAAQAAS